MTPTARGRRPHSVPHYQQGAQESAASGAPDGTAERALRAILDVPGNATVTNCHSIARAALESLGGSERDFAETIVRGDTGLSDEFPILWELALDADAAERSGRSVTPLQREADEALRELHSAAAAGLHIWKCYRDALSAIDEVRTAVLSVEHLEPSVLGERVRVRYRESHVIEYLDENENVGDFSRRAAIRLGLAAQGVYTLASGGKVLHRQLLHLPAGDYELVDQGGAV